MMDFDKQLIDLQIKIAYLENMTDGLNDVITAQDRQLKDLQDQLKLIYRYLEQMHGSGDDIAPFDLLNDKPPHY